MHQIASIIVYGMSGEILQHSPESPGLKHVALRHLSWTIAAAAAAKCMVIYHIYYRYIAQ